MSSRTAFALAAALLVGCPALLAAQDWEAVAASSDRSQDGLLVRMLNEGDLERQIALCRGLGRRQDRNIAPVIDFLTSHYSPGTADRTELLLRWLLASARSAHEQEADFQAWIDANSQSVDALLAGMDRWRSPMLKTELVACATVEGTTGSRQAIMKAGAQTVSGLQATGGWLSGAETALALAFLDAAGRVKDTDFLAACADIARLSRDRDVVLAARQAADSLR